MSSESKIDFYTNFTPNTQKIDIILQELGLDYKEHYIDFKKGEQFSPEFLKISPNNKIPALVDKRFKEPIVLFESGAILVHLAEQANKFLPKDPKERANVFKWLFWQVGGLGPMSGQLGHFKRVAKEKIPYAIERFSNEVHRLYKVLDGQLKDNEYIAGSEYSIADMATYPWIKAHVYYDIDLKEQYKNIHRWVLKLEERPVIKKLSEKIEASRRK